MGLISDLGDEVRKGRVRGDPLLQASRPHARDHHRPAQPHSAGQATARKSVDRRPSIHHLQKNLISRNRVLAQCTVSVGSDFNISPLLGSRDYTRSSAANYSLAWGGRPNDVTQARASLARCLFVFPLFHVKMFHANRLSYSIIETIEHRVSRKMPLVLGPSKSGLIYRHPASSSASGRNAREAQWVPRSVARRRWPLSSDIAGAQTRTGHYSQQVRLGDGLDLHFDGPGFPRSRRERRGRSRGLKARRQPSIGGHRAWEIRSVRSARRCRRRQMLRLSSATLAGEVR